MHIESHPSIWCSFHRSETSDDPEAHQLIALGRTAPLNRPEAVPHNCLLSEPLGGKPPAAAPLPYRTPVIKATFLVAILIRHEMFHGVPACVAPRPERYDARAGYAMYVDAVRHIGNILFPWTYLPSGSASEPVSWNYPTRKLPAAPPAG